MAKRGNARSAKRRLAIAGTALAAALSAAVITGGTAHATGASCGEGNGANICMEIIGSSNLIVSAVGSAKTDSPFTGFAGAASQGHVQVIAPNGRQLCASSPKSLGSSGVVMNCSWNGAGVAHETGNYCTIFWVYQDEGIFGWETVNDGEECLNVFVS